MDCVAWIRVALFALSAALPIVGLANLYFEVRSDKHAYDEAPKGADPNNITWGQMDWLVVHLGKTAEKRPTQVLRDFLFIGGGVVAGTVAAIWSVFIER